VPTPWLLGDVNSPLSRARLLNMTNASTMADRWRARTQPTVMATLFTDGVIPPAPMPGALAIIADDAERGELATWVDAMLETMRLIVGPRCTTSLQKILAFHTPEDDEVILGCFTSHLKHPKFTAEVVPCYFDDDLRVCFECDGVVPRFETESDFCYRLAARSRGQWEIKEYKHTPHFVVSGEYDAPGSFGVYHVDSIVGIDIGALGAEERARAAQSLAMRTLRRSLNPKSRCVGARRKVNAKAVGKTKAKKKAHDEDDADDDASHDDGDAGHEDADEDEDAEDALDMPAWKAAKKTSDKVEKKAIVAMAASPYPGLEWVFVDHVRHAGGNLAGRFKTMPSGDYYIQCKAKGHGSKCVKWCYNKKVDDGKRKSLQWLFEGEALTPQEHSDRWLVIRDGG
jgi:hypothetical protein